jgi:hypothetical protein
MENEFATKDIFWVRLRFNQIPTRVVPGGSQPLRMLALEHVVRNGIYLCCNQVRRYVPALAQY